MRRSKLIVVAAALANPVAAHAAPPKLMIVLSIDQLSADLFEEYRPHFTGGLARLAGGTVYRNGYQSHAATETCPGHATIITGTRPARNGIIANSWTDPAAPRADKDVYCVEDEAAPEGTSTDYVRSIKHLRVPTLGDMLQQRSPQSRVVAVSGKDRSAVLFGGHNPDGIYYLDGAKFVGSGKAVDEAGLSAVNRVVAAQVATAEPALTPPPVCAGKAKAVNVPGRGTVGTGAFARTAGDTSAWRNSPAMDGATLALGAVLANQMKLGRGAQTDLLGISLSATDYVGHSVGNGGQEMCLQLLELDRDLGDFFARLDGWGIDYAVALSADHGVADIPERERNQSLPARAPIDPALLPASISAAVRSATGLSGPILVGTGSVGDLYLDPAHKGADRAKAQAAVIAAYRKHGQVEAVFTKSEIAASPMPSGNPAQWPMIGRVRASFDPQRSGDLYVVLKPGITPVIATPTYVATHGSPWDYDRRVPIVFWRKGQPARAIETPVETIDIVPSVATLLELPLAPGAVDGKCLDAFADVRCPTQ